MSGNWIENYMAIPDCPSCKGARLKPEALSVILDRETIDSVTAMSIKQGFEVFQQHHTDQAPGDDRQTDSQGNPRAAAFLCDVGLDYLTLGRAAQTLSGGEAQRIRLATQIGSRLVGVLYILDEPSIGLHQRDNRKLLNTLIELRDIGNTVLVVEHDRETIEEADYRDRSRSRRRSPRRPDCRPGNAAGHHEGEEIAHRAVSLRRAQDRDSRRHAASQTANTDHS